MKMEFNLYIINAYIFYTNIDLITLQ